MTLRGFARRAGIREDDVVVERFATAAAARLREGVAAA
jgi:succinate dehydrogenase flavin-adding protein (antitoxin of CptAB toxin-antitoxin module)